MNFFNPLGTRLNWLEAMGIDHFHNRGLLSVALCQETPSCLTRLESGAHYPQEYGRVFNSFKRKRLKFVLLVHFNINQNRVRLKRLVPNLRLRLSVFPLVVRVLLRLSTACQPQSPATHKTRFTHTARTQYTHSTHTVRTQHAIIIKLYICCLRWPPCRMLTKTKTRRKSRTPENTIMWVREIPYNEAK